MRTVITLAELRGIVAPSLDLEKKEMNPRAFGVNPSVCLPEALPAPKETVEYRVRYQLQDRKEKNSPPYPTKEEARIFYDGLSAGVGVMAIYSASFEKKTIWQLDEVII
jgi:hypothetical protein